MTLTKKVAHNTLIQYTGKIIGTILGLFTIGFMTRYLGKDGFGYYTTIVGFLQFFGIMVDFGLSLTTAQMLGHSKWDKEHLFANILSLRVISSFVFLGVAPLVALFFPYPGFVKLGIVLTTTSFFFMSLSQIFIGYYQKHLSLIYVSYAEVGNRIFLLIAILLAIYFDLGLFAVLVAVILSNAIQLILLAIPAKKFGRIYWNVDFLLWKDIWSKTWPIAVSIALNLLYLKSDIIILSVFAKPEEVGLYGAAYKVVEVLMTFPIIFAGILLPLLSRFWQTGDKTNFRRMMQNGFDAMSILAWPMIVGTYFVSHDVMALIAGEEFRQSGLLLQLLIWATGIIFFASLFSHAIVALNKQKATIWAYAITAVIGLTGYFILIPKYGAIGAAIMTIITEVLVAIIIYILYVKFSRIRPSLQIWWGTIFSSFVMGVCLVSLSEKHLFIKILTAMAVYGITLLLTKTVSREFVWELMKVKQIKE